MIFFKNKISKKNILSFSSYNRLIPSKRMKHLDSRVKSELILQKYGFLKKKKKKI